MARIRHPLGVLFVHGIGEQPRGDTLLAFGEPLIQSIQQWVEGREIGQATVIESKLSASQLASGEPAHAVLQMTVCDRSPHTWLLAESWWAEEFRRPPFMKLAGWLLTVGPWAMISHTSRWRRDAPLLQRGYRLLEIILAIPLSWLMQIVVASVAVVAWLPIPVLRRSVSGFLLRITGTLGDSYVLLENPVQKAAAIGTLHHNVGWLADRCDKVVVVAHSQGAAIARLTLEERPHPKVCLLVTLGSGIAKLKELETLSTGGLARAVRTMLAVSMVAIALLPRALSLVPDDDVRSMVWSLFLLMPVAVVVAAVTVVWKEIESWPKRAAKLSLAPIDWIDYWATFDPVPNGPLAPDGVVEGLQQVKVTNRMSLSSDHSAYWDNREGFVLPLLRQLDQRAGTGAFAVEEPLQISIPERRTRVVVLATARAVVGWLAAPVLLFAFRDQLSAFGRDAVLGSLAQRPLTKPISELLTGLGSLVGAVGSLMGIDAASLDEVGHLAIGAIIPLAFVAAWYRFCVLPVWESWDTQCFDWLCRPAGIPRHPVDRSGRPLLLAVVAIVPLALAVRALFQSDVRVLLREGIDAIIFVPLVLVLLALLAVFVGWIVHGALTAIRFIRGLVTKQDASVDPTAAVGVAPGADEAHTDGTPEPPASTGV
jgi:pimeloyl-ACP methyl ester carboxylesterase